MKKILISLSVIGVVAAAAVIGTQALFTDQETSSGNVFTAGSIDLKVDHLVQTYNGVNCNTCSVTVVSDATNEVVAKSENGTDPVTLPHPAVLVNPINPAWTANVPGASWIWAQNPTPEAEYGIDTIYTFEKTFNWMGPVTGATLVLSIGADNSYEVYLNGSHVTGDNTEQNYNTAGQDVVSGTPISDHIVQGVNTLRFVVKNWARPAGQTWLNPGGLIYKLTIDGNCGDSEFKNHCTLFGEKNLGPDDHFWIIDDVKPGDYGTNLISLHVTSNDAYACLYTGNTADNENDLVNAETKANDDTPNEGELSKYLNVIVWPDNGDGIHQVSETPIYNGPLNEEMTSRLAIVGGGTEYLGLAWCAGDQDIDSETGTISCDGSGSQNDAQTDSFVADLTAYAVQQRNNGNFSCSDLRQVNGTVVTGEGLND
ncbi:MAG: SipW-dependent-type signal peptide-containing protein [Patescibacteria group bacterium]|nr:SipW-dependent-type signal peptide-containing protein [Patescibacteria group bacterium]